MRDKNEEQDAILLYVIGIILVTVLVTGVLQ